jgi:hypothetical protein
MNECSQKGGIENHRSRRRIIEIAGMTSVIGTIEMIVC